MVITDVARYKKDMCENFLRDNGECKKAEYCQFAHGAIKLRHADQSIEDYIKAHMLTNPKIGAIKIDLAAAKQSLTS